MTITFQSDKVKIKTGKVDNSATVEFEIGEYQLSNIKELVGLVDKIYTVTVETEGGQTEIKGLDL